MPLLRKMPKRGFNNTAFKKVWGVVNLRDLAGVEEGTVVDESFLRENGLIRGRVVGVKILGDGEITAALTFKVDGVSSAAQEKIKNAGGSVLIEKSTASEA